MTSRTSCRASRALRLVTAPLLVVGVAATAACAPVTTEQAYAPSDGVRVELSADVRAENLLVVSSGEGEPGALLGALTNKTGEDVDIAVQPEGAAPIRVPVRAGATVLLGTEKGFDAQFADIDVPPGATLSVTVDAGGDLRQSVQLPVLDGTLPEYSDLVPSTS